MHISECGKHPFRISFHSRERFELSTLLPGVQENQTVGLG